MAIAKLKTVFSTGAWINNVKAFFTKINEIIDYLNANDSTIAPTYKVYEGYITQTGLTAPTMESFVDTIGISDPWSYNSTGFYSLADPNLSGYSKGIVMVSQSTGHASGFINAYPHTVTAFIDVVGGTISLGVYDPENGVNIDGALSSSYIKIVLWS